MAERLAVLENTSARVFSAFVNLAVLVVTARALGPHGQGALVAATTWATLGAVLAGLSLGQVSHREIQNRRYQDWLPELMGTMLVIAIASSAIAYILLCCLVLFGDAGMFQGIAPRVIGLAGLLIPLIVLSEFSRNLLAASGQLRIYAIAQTVGNALRLAFVLVALGPLNLGVLGAVGAIVLSQGVIVAIQANGLWTASGRAIRPSLQQATDLLRGAWRLHPNSLASFLLPNANVMLLNQLVSSAAVGWYHLALQLSSALLLLPQAAGMVLYGKIARIGPDAAWPAQKQLMTEVLGIVLVLGVFAWLAAPWLIRLVAGEEFAPAVPIFRWLLVAILGLSTAELMAPQWVTRGFFLRSAILTCIAAVANVSLNIVLIRRFGFVGAAWGAAITYLFFVAVTQVSFAAWCEARSRRQVGSTEYN
jgi:O-antigen/teichoic acid export membrane protein